ncbi:MAG: polyprenyl synthetase family protein [Alphaproteobacteria bacterium]|nr:polyprenyl synthetase family protein [Alphaproteobacteria bacterium]
MSQTLKNRLVETRKLVDSNLERWLPLPASLDRRVVEAMRYSSIGGGKAFRAFLILTISAMYNVPQDQALNIATALEMVHAYSLIHDDLPAMDNDTMRRGKPTNHIQFDEATAILAGDGLLTNAFEVLAHPSTHPDASIRIKLVGLLAQLAGKSGMIGGQMMDLIGEKTPLDLKEIEQMQDKKTGALLTFACIAGAIAGYASESDLQALTTYAKCIGLTFQITDDILDVTGDTALMGKTLGKDKQTAKSTFVSLLGLDQARKMAEDLMHKADDAIASFGEKADLLHQANHFILERNY